MAEGLIFYVQRHISFRKRDKPSNFRRFSVETQISDLRRVCLKSSGNSAAVLGVPLETDSFARTKYRTEVIAKAVGNCQLQQSVAITAPVPTRNKREKNLPGKRVGARRSKKPIRASVSDNRVYGYGDKQGSAYSADSDKASYKMALS